MWSDIKHLQKGVESPSPRYLPTLLWVYLVPFMLHCGSPEETLHSLLPILKSQVPLVPLWPVHPPPWGSLAFSGSRADRGLQLDYQPLLVYGSLGIWQLLHSTTSSSFSVFLFIPFLLLFFILSLHLLLFLLFLFPVSPNLLRCKSECSTPLY